MQWRPIQHFLEKFSTLKTPSHYLQTETLACLKEKGLLLPLEIKISLQNGVLNFKGLSPGFKSLVFMQKEALFTCLEKKLGSRAPHLIRF